MCKNNQSFYKIIASRFFYVNYFSYISTVIKQQHKMTKLTIQAQYHENYNVGPEGVNTYGDKLPHWKPKGGHEFVINGFDADDLFYDEENVISAIKSLIANQSNEFEKFEYISHELNFSEPTEIKLNDFKSKYAETNRV